MVSIDKSLCIGCNACVRNCSMGVLTPGQGGPEVHPGRRCILCMHCAAGCPARAVRFEEIPPEEVYREFPEDPLEKLIMARRSIRHFQDKLPPREVVERALRTAVYAPSGKNQRAYRFTVLWGSEQVSLLRQRCLALCEEYGEAPELPKLMKKGTDLLTCGAPCMIVVWSPDDCLNPVLDAGAVQATLELILANQGLSTCWGGYLRQVSDRFPEIREMLHIPEGSRVRCALMVGYAKAERYPNAVWHAEPEAIWLEGDHT